MLAIHTVAAGGGSILHFDGSRYRVGPDSAGAVPGPAAYRRGGPLTVTDANIMLGRIQAGHFPAVFGPGGDQPLDTAVVAEKFAALAAEIGAATGQRATSRGGGRRVPGHRGREHGQRDQEDLGAARLRRDQVRARHVRRGRRPARLRGRRRAGHRNRPHPPARRGAVRLRDGPGRRHRHAGAGGGGAARKGAGGGWAARRTRPGRGRPGGRRAGRTGRRGRRPGPRDPGAPGAPALRGHRHRAARPAGHRGRT